jgi:hypothetical protein
MKDTLNQLKENLYDIEKWEEIGFLDNLNEEDKEKCAFSYGYVSEYIMKFLDKIPVVAYPIIKGLVKNKYTEDLSVRKLINTILDVYEEFSFEIDEHDDMDSEVCIEVIERIKKEAL